MENSVIGVLIGKSISSDCRREFQAHSVIHFYIVSKCFAKTIIALAEMIRTNKNQMRDSFEHLFDSAVDVNLKSHQLPILLRSLKRIKLKKVLILAMLCVALAGAVELENICSDDTFEYEGVLVNALHRVQFNITLQPLRAYLIHDSVKCYYSQFQNKTNYWEVLRMKRG